VRPLRAYGIGFDAPVLASIDPWAFALSLAAAMAIFWFKVGMIPVLLACSAAGMLLFALGFVT
jgi:chromate transporter